MKRSDLSQLYFLNKEIEADKNQLNRLKSNYKSIGSNEHFTLVLQRISDLESQLNCKIQSSIDKYNSILSYINSIDDSQIRLILSLRYVNGWNWTKIASAIGGDNTPDSIRMTHNRFLNRFGS